MSFPALAPVCARAGGDALLLLTRQADVWAQRLPRGHVTGVLLPLLARAADQGAGACRERIMRARSACDWPCHWRAAAAAGARRGPGCGGIFWLVFTGQSRD